MTEVLQGLKRDPSLIAKYLLQWDLIEPQGIGTYLEAAQIFRLLRSKGISPKTVDTIIAAIAIENHARLFSLDQDFRLMARWIPLGLYELP